MILKTRAENFDLAQGPLLMGILNVTPDSFSDGGKFMTPEAAVARAEVLAEEGADIIDVGGESTRPGAAPVSLDEEMRRVVPIVEILAGRFPRIPISVDTMKSQVARACLEEGASLINDVSALRSDPGIADVLREHGVPFVLMHMRGEPRTMQVDPSYQNVVGEIRDFFRERISFAEGRGLRRDNIILDPGVGFGKTTAHNVEILRGLPDFLPEGLPLLVGLSRKAFIGRILGSEENPLPPLERGEGTLAAHIFAAARGAHILRVHDVKSTRRALKIWKSLALGDPVMG